MHLGRSRDFDDDFDADEGDDDGFGDDDTFGNRGQLKVRYHLFLRLFLHFSHWNVHPWYSRNFDGGDNFDTNEGGDFGDDEGFGDTGIPSGNDGDRTHISYQVLDSCVRVSLRGLFRVRNQLQ